MKNLGKLIGIFGGTFDPIHLGHLNLANEVYRHLNLKEISFLPCNQSSIKKKPVANIADRLAMLELAIRYYPYFNINDCEIKRSGISYTIDTLKFLRQEIDSPLCFIMAMDTFAQFNLWHKWQEILTLTHLVIANRPDNLMPTNKEILQLLNERQSREVKDLQANIAGKIYLINIKPNPISATLIRDLIKDGKDASHLLPRAVWNYIKQHNLYHKSQN